MENEKRGSFTAKCPDCTLDSGTECIFREAVSETLAGLEARGVDEETRKIVSEVLLGYIRKRHNGKCGSCGK